MIKKYTYKFARNLSLFLGISLTLLFLNCTKYEEEAPFFDGLYLKYYEVFSNSEESKDIIWTREIEYRFKQLESENFNISQIVNTKRGKRLDKKLETPSFPQVGNDLIIDGKGIVLKSEVNFNFPEGMLSYLWLPSDKRKEGPEMIKMIRKVEERTRWEGLEVWPVKGILGDMHYYDADTGYLVGSENISGKLKMRIIDTNYAELKAILSE